MYHSKSTVMRLSSSPDICLRQCRGRSDYRSLIAEPCDCLVWLQKPIEKALSHYRNYRIEIFLFLQSRGYTRENVIFISMYIHNDVRTSFWLFYYKGSKKSISMR